MRRAARAAARRCVVGVLAGFLFVSMPIGVAAFAAESSWSSPAPTEHGDDPGPESEAHAEEHHGQPWVPIVFNFTLFVGGLAYFLRKPVSEFFSSRKEEIVEALTAAERARSEATAKLAEVEGQLDEVQARAAEIVDAAKKQAVAERKAIVQAANDEAERIRAQAEARVSDMEAGASRRLQGLAADLSVGLARDIIQREIQAKDRARLMGRFLKDLRKVAS